MLESFIMRIKLNISRKEHKEYTDKAKNSYFLQNDLHTLLLN